MSYIIKKIFAWSVIPLVQWYLTKDRNFRYQQLKVKVFRGVFHPGFYFSTKLLLKHLGGLSLARQKFLELGAGTGIISLLAARQGAQVTASDINPDAIANICHNKQTHKAKIEVIQSDLFDSFADRTFDYIVINPPYYPKNPQSNSEQAWYCGENFEYFTKLFGQLPDFLKSNGQAIMILSSDCAIDHIRQMAQNHGLQWQQIKKVRVWWEHNYLFKITCQPSQSAS
mgnify:FL=1